MAEGKREPWIVAWERLQSYGLPHNHAPDSPPQNNLFRNHAAPNQAGQSNTAVNPSRAEVLGYTGSNWTLLQDGINLIPHQASPAQPTLPNVCYVFLENGEWFKGEEKERDQADADRRSILASFNMPELLAGDMCTHLNGFFGCKSSLDADDKLAEFSTWFRCLTKHVLNDERPVKAKDYTWYEMGFFTRWTAAGNAMVLCVGTPPAVREGLRRRLVAASDVALGDPFAMTRLLLDEVVDLYDKHTWMITKLVREVEKNRGAYPSFEKLNNLSRHIGHMVEVEAVALETLAHIAQGQKAVWELLPASAGSGAGITAEYKRRADEYLAFQEQLVRSVRWRALATQQRLCDEITLAYNMLASSDNAVMKSVTLLTLVFLPATFISALFSTTFFSFADDSWKFSNKFWIYWVVTLPLTLILLFGWWFIILGGSSKIRSDWLGKTRRSGAPPAAIQQAPV